MRQSRAQGSASEHEIQNAIRLALGHLDYVVVWRNNVGLGETRQGGRVRFGLAVGSSDLIGIVQTHSGIGRFVGLEVKKPGGKASDEQSRWLRLVQRLGGHGAVVHSVEEALAAIEAAREG